MQESKITTAIILDTRRAKNNGKYPVKLRITHLPSRPKQKYYNTAVDLTETEFAVAMESSGKGKNKELRLRLNDIERKAQEIISETPNFSFELFDKKFLKPRSSWGKVFDLFDEEILMCRQANRIGSAVSYECAKKALASYKEQLRFEDITVAFLEKFEQAQIAKGNSYTTVGIYCRHLRAIYNQAIRQGFASVDNYPFGDDKSKKYVIPASQNIKKALDISHIKKIAEYEAVPFSTIDKARDFWLFSYLCNGINIKDIVQLKYSNLRQGVIEYSRAKTIRTTKGKMRKISIPLLPEALRVIEKWGNKQKDADSFIFPINSKEFDSSRERAVIQQFTKTINRGMKAIADELGIDKPATTYVARHSFATILKRSGAAVDFISEQLGHHDTATTQSYLKSFETDQKLKAYQALVNF